jgi:hypothetical protein
VTYYSYGLDDHGGGNGSQHFAQIASISAHIHDNFI